MTEKDITFTVNGTECELSVEPRKLLVHAIREDLDLTGTHIGCDTGNCGACTVQMDGEAMKSCMLFAVQCDGSEITTVEGMADRPEAGMGETDLHPIQEGFKQMHGLQCGFCTPGMIVAGATLLEENDDPTDAEIREKISGNLCRCTGYQNIVKSIQYASAVLNGREPPASPVENPASGAEGAPGVEEPAADGGEPRTESGEPRTDGGSCACGDPAGGCAGPDRGSPALEDGGERDE